MAYEQKKNTAALFPNTRAPEKSDYNGRTEVECGHCGKSTGFWLNGWNNMSKTGGKYIKIVLKAMSNARPGGNTANDDDIPW